MKVKTGPKKLTDQTDHASPVSNVLPGILNRWSNVDQRANLAVSEQNGGEQADQLLHREEKHAVPTITIASRHFDFYSGCFRRIPIFITFKMNGLLT